MQIPDTYICFVWQYKIKEPFEAVEQEPKFNYPTCDFNNAGSETGPYSDMGGECFPHFLIPSPGSLLPMASMANWIIKRNV